MILLLRLFLCMCPPQGSEGMNAVPTTSQEVADCDRTLTAQELYQVDIGQRLKRESEGTRSSLVPCALDNL